ncbi:hypothetical protein EZS27_021887 [termite gut metagenome]|uniref:Uncharacterized protein n=1 Tax=termite gut metagenome TaxID=433724 RepID=A0A5J4R9B8_9ZZZZ
MIPEQHQYPLNNVVEVLGTIYVMPFLHEKRDGKLIIHHCIWLLWHDK